MSTESEHVQDEIDRVSQEKAIAKQHLTMALGSVTLLGDRIPHGSFVANHIKAAIFALLKNTQN
jgi:hypothetical protein